MDASAKPILIPSFNRALWIIGNTGSGKTTLANKIKEHLKLEVIELGQYIRSMHCKEASVIEMTASALSILSKDHRYFSKKLNNTLQKTNTIIIVGARNPVDFIDNFDPVLDGVLFINFGLAQTEFEEYGIRAIKNCIDFFLNCGLIDKKQIILMERNE